MGPNAVFTLGRLRSPGSIQLLSQQQSLRRSRPDQFRNNFAETAASPTPASAPTIRRVKGIHNVKAGITYQQTFLNENDHFGIIDPTVASVNTRRQRQSVLQHAHRHRRSRNSVRHAASDRSDPRRQPLQFPRTHRRQRTFDVRAGHDHERHLVVQPRHSRRSLQRSLDRAPSRTARRHRLQHQADQHRAARFVRAHAGNSVQRKSDHRHDRLQRAR